MGKDKARGEQERQRWLQELEAECHSEEGWAPTGGGTWDADADAMRELAAKQEQLLLNTVVVKNANWLCLSQKLSVFALILGWWQQFIPFANLAHFH